MADHTHDVRDLNIDVAPLDHDHACLDVHGVAPERHSHTMHDLSGVPTSQEFARLMDRVAELELQLSVERAVPDAVAEGADTAERIAAAIERRCDLMAGFDQHTYLRTQLRELAREIRESASR